MDAMMTATTATTRAAELRTKINGLYRRKGEVELALQREHIVQERAVAKRKELVGELPGADAATEAWAYSEIDAADNALKLSIRTAEGLQGTLTKLLNEIAPLEIELAEATRIIEQGKREQALRVFEIQLQEDRYAIEEALSSLRLALTALNLTASQGVEQYGVAAQNLVTPVLEALQRQHNPESLGWRYKGLNYGNFVFTVRPMVKDAAKR
jgi:hypothetical protein